MDLIYWDHYYNKIIFLNMMIVIGLFTALRLFSGFIAHINASNELLKKDNAAFGVSLAGATFAITIMLSGIIYGSPENNSTYSIISVGVFGLTGIAMMAITRLVFNRITLPAVSLRDEIVKGNMAVAIADAGNVIAAAIIIRAALIWITVGTYDGISVLVAAYAVSQTLLTTMTFLRMKVFGLINQGYCLQRELNNGNAALALKFAGQKIGTAFAIATAAQVVVYEEYDIAPILLAWMIASVAAIIIWKALCFIAEQIILFRVDKNQEIIEQKNVALGALLAVIYISLGLLISSV